MEGVAALERLYRRRRGRATVRRRRTPAGGRLRNRSRPGSNDRRSPPGARGHLVSAKPTGFVLVDKPTGPTSHDIVDTVRRAFGVRRVGHAGTLDPAASGL